MRQSIVNAGEKEGCMHLILTCLTDAFRIENSMTRIATTKNVPKIVRKRGPK
jgi:hypothetical protein